MEELLKTIADRLEPWELVEFLQIPMEEIIEAHLETIEDKIEDIKEIIEYNDEQEED